MKITRYLTLFALAASLAASCASNKPKSQTSTDQQTVARTNPPAPPQEQVLKENTNVQPQLQQSNEVAGQANIPVTRTTTRTVMTQNQMPVLTINQQKADINRMSADNFTALGFPADVSQRIVMIRNARPGGFTSPHDLAQIQGVDPNLLSSLEPNLGVATINAPVTQQAGTAAPNAQPTQATGSQTQ